MVEVSHLSKNYGSHPAIRDLTFSVADGQVYGLLGPNGAGKSTIMNILTSYLAPTGGEVKVAGFSLPEQAQQAKACVGYLPEQPPLYPEMTVQEYLDFAAELKGVKKAQRREQVQQAARRTGLDQVMPRLIRSLSKGYRQRVGIAQALLGSPQLIILDEPTVGLDPAQVIGIRKLIRELGKTHTVILSSHILSEVQAVCSRVLILSKGALVAEGTPEQLSEKLSPGIRLRVTALGSSDTVLPVVEAVPGITMENYRALIRHILDTTQMNVALIPHVVWKNNDDRTVLKRLYEDFKETGRIVLIEDCGCEELKGYIARCRFFIGARTHATIAAYSSLVPTLVVGYSVKARGIAKDLFGTWEDYVLPVQSLRQEGELIEGFEWLKNQEQFVKTRLEKVMPAYLERARQMGKILGKLAE